MADVAPWPPTRHSPPLAPDFDSLFARYRDVFRIAWHAAGGYTLDEWQESLLCAITEFRPDGRLRWRQYVVSVARQNGKSEIAAALALLFLLWKTAPYVVGIASSAEQARLVYDRAMSVIRRNAALSGRFDRMTDTRGIATATGGKYELKAAKSAALQGIPVDLGVADEVHILKPTLWTDLVNGTGGRPDCLIVGITTAGDDTSELLKHLYKVADEGQIGHAIWEADEADIPADDETLGLYLRQANPAIACGRVDLATVVDDVRSMPPHEAIRYRLNRFVAAENVFIPLRLWTPLAGSVTPPKDGVVFSVDRTPSWSYASIVGAWEGPDGVLETQVVASMTNPTQERLLALCQNLAGKARLFVMDAKGLGGLAEEMKRRGMPVHKGPLGDATSAAGRLYARVLQGALRHAGDQLLTVQLPGTATKNVDDSFRLVRGGKGDIDAVVATAMAVYMFEAKPDMGPQLFV